MLQVRPLMSTLFISQNKQRRRTENKKERKEKEKNKQINYKLGCSPVFFIFLLFFWVGGHLLPLPPPLPHFLEFSHLLLYLLSIGYCLYSFYKSSFSFFTVFANPPPPSPSYHSPTVRIHTNNLSLFTHSPSSHTQTNIHFFTIILISIILITT